jgi:hypothetical protein
MEEEIDQHHSRQQLRMAETAIKKGWDIPEQVLTALPKVAAKLALSGKPRDQLAAMRVLIAMKQQNEQPQVTQGQTINVGVNIENNTDERRRRTLAIAERVRAGRVLSDVGTGRPEIRYRSDSEIDSRD